MFLSSPKDQNIGPGHYNTISSMTQDDKRKKQSSIFSSKVNRTAFGIHRNKAKQLLRERRKMQSIDTYLEDIDSSSSEDNGPGPGNYDPYKFSSFK